MNFVRMSLNSLVKLQQMFRIAEIELGMENMIRITPETCVGVQSAILHICQIAVLVSAEHISSLLPFAY